VLPAFHSGEGPVQCVEFVRPFLLACNHSDAGRRMLSVAISGMQRLVMVNAIQSAEPPNILRVLQIQVGVGTYQGTMSPQREGGGRWLCLFPPPAPAGNPTPVPTPHGCRPLAPEPGVVTSTMSPTRLCPLPAAAVGFALRC
jgi:hypothetical protein